MLQTITTTPNGVAGTTFVPYQPSSCPGCGRCNTCGRGPEVYIPPYNPYGYPHISYSNTGAMGQAAQNISAANTVQRDWATDPTESR